MSSSCGKRKEVVMIFKIRYLLRGGHYHCDLFAAPRFNTTYAKCGSFVVRENEFTTLRACMQGITFEDGDPILQERVRALTRANSTTT